MHILASTFNKNTVKLSYCCMPSMKAKIDSHNKKLLNEDDQENPPKGVDNCSCPAKKKENCPLQNRCLDRNIIYQATVDNISDHETETYIGLTSSTFKERLATHKQSFNNRNVNQTTLSTYIWQLKDGGKFFSISYKIVDRGKPYSSKYKKCGLCTKEKTWIITQPNMATLNKRTELTAKCRHREKWLLQSL